MPITKMNFKLNSYLTRQNTSNRIYQGAVPAICWKTVVDPDPVSRRCSGRIQLAVGPQPLWLRNHNFGLAQWIMVKRLATSPHDPLGITDSACKNQLVVVSVQYGPFNTYIPIRSTTIGKSRVAKDPIAMHTSWRSNSDIASVTSCYKGRVGKEVSILEREQQLQRCDNHSLRNTVTLYHNDIDRRISQLVEAKKEHKSTQVALEASHMTIVGLTEIGLQDDNGAPAPFDDKWEEEPEEDPEEERLEDIPIDEGDIVDE
ncbi:hypothetical protein F511_39955 [Dorcoceras hygrometricum]|uniref:Uncharacterized protein n=1 Tax=Dorcoceras hygrometricum TaxID=472368 RepID=A0A2Z7DH39_9LAMI|nr:hypothetical protein F511_39955 [Dorcoceras hygrometricum]